MPALQLEQLPRNGRHVHIEWDHLRGEPLLRAQLRALVRWKQQLRVERDRVSRVLRAQLVSPAIRSNLQRKHWLQDGEWYVQ